MTQEPKEIIREFIAAWDKYNRPEFTQRDFIRICEAVNNAKRYVAEDYPSMPFSIDSCPVCHGSGKVAAENCARCGKHGVIFNRNPKQDSQSSNPSKHP